MTCPGCGAQDDQSCRRGCPEILAAREEQLRRCQRCGCHWPRVQVVLVDEFGVRSMQAVRDVYRDGDTLVVYI